MSYKLEIDSRDLGSYFATNLDELSFALRIVANWYQSGSFEEYKKSDEYVKLGRVFGTWLAENEYNYLNGNIVLVDFFEAAVKAYKKEMKNA